jgi:hypothetical protein
MSTTRKAQMKDIKKSQEKSHLWLIRHCGVLRKLGANEKLKK